MSIPANPQPPVYYILTNVCLGGRSYSLGHLIYKCGGIDKRTIEKFEKVGIIAGVATTFPRPYTIFGGA